MESITKNYWVIYEDSGRDDGVGTSLDGDYYSLGEAELRCNMLNEIYSPRKFFVVQLSKSIDFEQLTCSYCGAKEGEYHELFCDYERCPFCSGQLASCGCEYSYLNLRDAIKYGPETDFLPPKIYNEGLSQEQLQEWALILKAKGRIRSIKYPIICARCGKLWPDFFRVPDHEWKHYIQPDMRNTVICMDCYDIIRYLIDTGGPDTI